MKQLLRLSALVLSLLAGDMASAQCTPVDCLSSLPPFGGVCPGDLPEGRVNVAYNASLSFHVTNECFAATLLDPTLTGVGVRITQLNTFTFTNLPAGLGGATSAPTYAPPANGCASVSGTPTEAGVFDATIGILANVVAYPFSLACGGFSVNQNGNAIDEVRVITILPDPTFTGVSGAYCVTDGAVALTATGTPGGEFSGPGVVGSTFDPALAGVGNHSITYTVSAQQGAAVAPATDSFTIVVEVNDACISTCDALAGTLTATGEPCLLDGEATLTATADGNAVVPAGYQTVYVLTEGAGLVIINAGSSPEFTVDAAGTYIIHTLVYDPNTLGLGGIEFGVTTGFEVNAVLIQGGGTICASLDVAGAPFTVEACVVTCDALAGTLTADGEPCLADGEAVLSATADGNAVVPVGYQTVYVLTEGAGLVIMNAGPSPDFTVDAEGDYTIHTLVYDPNTLDLGIVELGVTTGFDVNGLLIQGGGTICASLDVAGAPFTVEACVVTCDALAGTLTADGEPCLLDGAATLTASPDGNAVVPAGYQTVYVLTEGAGLVIVNAGPAPVFPVDAEGSYTIHTLVYDPNTLDLGIVELGVTTGFDVNGLLIQGGGTICASLDVAGAPFTVEACVVTCDALAGTLTADGEPCLLDGAATLTATADGNAVVPPGYQVVYALTSGPGLVIIAGNTTPEFTVDAEGDYTIHTLVYDPNTLDLSIVEFGVTTGFDVNSLLIQGGGSICASLDVAGAAFSVELCCDAVAGTLSGGGVACFEDGAATLTSTPDGNAEVPAGFQTVYVLTEGAGLVIINAGATPEFTVDAEGDYTIHTLVYDPNTLDLGIVEFGVTTGFDVNSLLIQGGGTICASLDVAGAAFTVEACTPTGYCTAGATSTSFEKIANVTVAGINNSSTATDGYEDFTAVVGTMAQDGLYPITVTLANPFESDEVLVWIDFDQNQQFDASELVYSSPLGEGPHSGTITVPLGASLGNTIMRVRLHDTAAGANDTPCGTSTYGQVEDYTINIIEALPPCEAVAGSLTADPIGCLESLGALLNISASPDGNAIVPAGYSTVYVLTQGAGLVIVDAGGTPSFDVDENGVYTIHTLVYDPTTLDLGIVEFGVTTGFDVNSLLIQGGGLICASLDVAGAAFDIELCCDAVAGTLSGGGVVCFEDGAATLTATPDGNAEVPAGYQTVYVLTEGAGLVIINAGATPEFTVDAEGDYTIHTLVYDPNTLDLGIVEFGVTTGFDVNGLLIQGGGTTCASLDVAGAAYQVAVCGVYCTAGATSLSFEKIANVTFADIDNSSTSTAGYEDFTTVVGNVSRGSAYDINLDISDPYETDELLVWIDYDQNGVFSANELAYNSAIAEGPYSGSITIPVDAPLGETRMRVRLHDTAAGANATPCGTSTYGQVEDYTIDIDVSTGLVEATSIATSVFPNPNMGDFSVRYGADATVVLELMDMSGRLVYTEQRATTSTEVMQLSLAGRLAPGTYILRMNSDLGRSEQRIVVGQ